MKISRYYFVFLLALLTSCSSLQQKAHDASEAKKSPETVLITYHVRPGKEADMEAVLRHEWEIYQKEHLVFAPHLVVRDKDAADKPRIVEIFTWVSRSIPDHAPDSVKAVWNDMQALCEPRDGHGGLEISEVEVVAAQIR